MHDAEFRQANFTVPACWKKVYISSNEIKGLSIFSEKFRMNRMTQFLYVRSVPELHEVRLILFGNFPPIPKTKFPIFSNAGKRTLICGNFYVSVCCRSLT